MQSILALNLHKSAAISTAIYGNFSGPKAQEVVAAKGNAIELLRPDDTGKMWSVCLTPVFSIVRSLLPFRPLGSNRDLVIMGTDSGKISIIEFDIAINDWKSVHIEVFGKTGCRRIVPGQYLAADPKGRAIMIGAIEKQKFVYVMNRDSANRLTISSPLEAHKSDTIVFSIVGVDVNFDNPIFAMIELDYSEVDQDPTGEALQEVEKRLTYYELDLGLNHVVRKWSEPISRTANLLLSVPGGDDGPSGVLICGENWISYKNQGHAEIRTVLPRRHDMPAERGILITTGTVHKQKDLFFFMIQSELGDLYKVTLTTNPANPSIVTNVIATVFDTVQPANSLCITKTGLLYVASEFSNHSLFQFQGIGDDLNAVRSEKIDDSLNEELGDDSFSAAQVAPTFKPNSKLQNLALIDDIDSLAPVTDMLIDDLAGEESPQIHTLCGRGNRSTLRILRHGVSVTEMAVSELPGRPHAVWTVRHSNDNPYDKYIVVSFANATLTLSIGDTVEEVTDSGFLASAPTLQVVQLADNALLQVHSMGIRHIRPDARVAEWKTPDRKTIEKAAVNSRQVAISLSGGEIFYFELDDAGTLVEMGTIDMGKEVSCLDMGVVPASRARSSFLAVGCWDDTVQLFSLDPGDDQFTQRATMSLPSRPESVCLVHMSKERSGVPSNTSSSSKSTSEVSTLYLNVGLVTGVLVRVDVDPTSGTLSDSRQRFLGPKAIKLFRVTVSGQPGVLALSTRAWLMYNYQNRYFQAPVTYESLEYASGFSSELCQEGIVGVCGNTLRIVTVDTLGSEFNQTSFPLRYTPRRMAKVPGTQSLIIVESDHNEYNESEKAAIAAQAGDMDVTAGDSNKKASGGGEENEDEEEEEDGATILPVRGPLPPTEGKWASCVRVHSCGSNSTTDIVELTDNEAAFSVCSCRFTHTHSDEIFVCVGTAKDMTLHPRRISMGYIYVYRLLDGQLSLLHKTEVEDVPLTMVEFQGKLLVGIGKCLRLFELGKKKLLRKCENRLFPTAIVRVGVMGDRVFVADMTESVHFVKYRRQENTLAIFADDTVPRFITGMTALDYHSVGCGDKFGNVFILSLPEGVNDDVESASGTRVLWDQGLLNGAPNKIECMTHYYLGEAVTCIQKCSLVVGGPEVMVVSTVTGGIYAFMPFAAKDDIQFFHHVEMYMRQESLNLAGRDHLSYRSYFQPVKQTTDGDLCQRYSNLPYSKQKELADDIDRSPSEIIKKIEETRNIL